MFRQLAHSRRVGLYRFSIAKRAVIGNWDLVRKRDGSLSIHNTETGKRVVIGTYCVENGCPCAVVKEEVSLGENVIPLKAPFLSVSLSGERS